MQARIGDLGTERHRALLAALTVAGLLVAGLFVAVPAQAVDSRPPKIIRAAMGDADGDDRADRLVLTYSEKISHTADRDGRYPFDVIGYRVRRVGAASGSTKLVVTLKEKDVTDISSAPAVTYARTSSDPVRDLAGNQAKAQTFSGTTSLDVDADGVTKAGGDCAPADPLVYPGAVDLPEPSFADADCDGIDGEADNAAFVATTGSGTSCTRATPCASLEAGIDAADAGGLRNVYVAGGEYPDNGFQMADGISVYGAFGQNFQRDPAAATGSTVSVIGGSLVTDVLGSGPVGATVTLVAHDLTTTATVADLTLRGLDASTSGASSYVIHAEDVPDGTLAITRNTISSGDGAAGADGSDGLSAATVESQSAMDGVDGGDGVEQSVSCDDSSRGVGGSGGTNSSADTPSTRDMDAGAGGDGGTMDTDCSVFNLDLDARAGEDGFDADHLGGSFGAHGTGGTGTSQCGPTTDGEPGLVANGPGGSASTGGFVAGGFWFARDGGNGGTGENGGGGGGGGGAGGCDDGTDAWGGGGAGGGAGGMAARGGGTGGEGGGASVGIALVNADPTITDNDFTLGVGGDGGAGGTGGRGQSGGLGGDPGANPGGATPGAGGDGGHGGHGGGGAGGNGGRSVGILVLEGTAPVTSGNTFDGGTPGAGGAGGTSAPGAPVGEQDGNDGQAGFAGTLSNMLACVGVTDC